MAKFELYPPFPFDYNQADGAQKWVEAQGKTWRKCEDNGPKEPMVIYIMEETSALSKIGIRAAAVPPTREKVVFDDEPDFGKKRK